MPWRPILLVGAALVLFYMVDTAAFTWGPTYLERAVDAPSGLVALATFPYLRRAAWSGSRVTTWYAAGPVRVLRVGTLVACGGLAVVVFAPAWPVAVLGFLVMGGGVAVVAPLSFSAAARLAGGDTPDPGERGARVDAVIARFNQFNYVGALLGAVMTGVVGAGSLRIGFAVPMVLVLGILPLAKAFDPGRADTIAPCGQRCWGWGSWGPPWPAHWLAEARFRRRRLEPDDGPEPKQRSSARGSRRTAR